jgi:hypothetical protein
VDTERLNVSDLGGVRLAHADAWFGRLSTTSSHRGDGCQQSSKNGLGPHRA